MTEILFLFVIVFLVNALHIIGFNTVTDYDESVHESRMLLWKVREWSVKTFGEFASKPICTCCPCMASLHSTYVYFPLMVIHFSVNFWIALLCWPVYALALSGLVVLINHRG